MELSENGGIPNMDGLRVANPAKNGMTMGVPHFGHHQAVAEPFIIRSGMIHQIIGETPSILVSEIGYGITVMIPSGNLT
jgi:hypothetical protein